MSQHAYDAKPVFGDAFSFFKPWAINIFMAKLPVASPTKFVALESNSIHILNPLRRGGTVRGGGREMESLGKF